MRSETRSARRLTVLSVDDHPLIRSALGEVLAEVADPLELIEASHPEEGLELLREHASVDLAFMDLSYPQHDGLQFIERFRAAAPATPLVVFTMHDQPKPLMQALERGAAGVVPKRHSRMLLLKAVELVMAGGVYVPHELVHALALKDGTHTPPPARAESRVASPVAMSPQQQRILHFLAEGVSNKQIARELGIASSTVKNQLTLVFEKLGVSNRTQAAIAVRALREAGLSLRPVPRS
jgi:DNA-binding NarL/FixJ family response regulator